MLTQHSCVTSYFMYNRGMVKGKMGKENYIIVYRMWSLSLLLSFLFDYSLSWVGYFSKVYFPRVWSGWCHILNDSLESTPWDDKHFSRAFFPMSLLSYLPHLALHSVLRLTAALLPYQCFPLTPWGIKCSAIWSNEIWVEVVFETNLWSLFWSLEDLFLLGVSFLSHFWLTNCS